MTRKSIVQIAAQDRARTAKWRAAKVASRSPEARQVDKALLEGIFYVTRSGASFLLDEKRLQEAVTYAGRLLSKHHDAGETAYMMQSRMHALAKSTSIADMIRKDQRKVEFDLLYPETAASRRLSE